MFYLNFLDVIKQQHKHLNVAKYKKPIEQERLIYKQKMDEEVLLKIWLCLEIIKSVKRYNIAFRLLKNKYYKKAWDVFADIEISIDCIIENIHNYGEYPIVSYLNHYVKKYQSIYPYRCFFSAVEIIKKSECSICGKNMDPFSGCKHSVGKVYSGELCCEIVRDLEHIQFDVVFDPAIRKAVCFVDIENPAKYELLEYLIPRLTDEYMDWDYDIESKYEPHSKYNAGRNEPCPCTSGKKYKRCCMNNPNGIEFKHYVFSFPKNVSLFA